MEPRDEGIVSVKEEGCCPLAGSCYVEEKK